MQVVLAVGILVSLFLALVLIHNGSVNLLREAAIYLLRAANWCDARRAAAAALVRQRLEAQFDGSISPKPLAQLKSAGSRPVDAVRLVVRVIENMRPNSWKRLSLWRLG